MSRNFLPISYFLGFLGRFPIRVRCGVGRHASRRPLSIARQTADLDTPTAKANWRGFIPCPDKPFRRASRILCCAVSGRPARDSIQPNSKLDSIAFSNAFKNRFTSDLETPLLQPTPPFAFRSRSSPIQRQSRRVETPNSRANQATGTILRGSRENCNRRILEFPARPCNARE